MGIIRALLVLSLMLTAQCALADSCVPRESVERELASSTIVVAAEAKTVRVEFVGHPLDRSKPREVQVVEWQVLESWKGQYKTQDWLKTRTVINDPLMGRSVAADEAYLLYLIDPSWVSTCGRTSVLKHAVRDIPVLYRLAGKNPDGT